MLKMNLIKKTYLLFGLAIASVILHNAFYGIFNKEEPVFFILAIGLFFAFVISVIYNTISYLRKREPKDLWKLGWLGLFGLSGLMPGFNYGLFGFFGFFGFFGARDWKRLKNN